MIFIPMILCMIVLSLGAGSLAFLGANASDGFISDASPAFGMIFGLSAMSLSVGVFVKMVS